MTQLKQRPALRDRFRRTPKQKEPIDEVSAEPTRIRRFGSATLNQGRKVGTRLTRPLRQRKKLGTADGTSRRPLRHRLANRFRRAKHAYNNPKNLRRRLTLSYAFVTLSVMLIMYVLFALFESGDFEDFLAFIVIGFIPFTLFFGTIALFLGSFFGYFVSRNLVTRLRALDGAASAWATGDFSAQISDDSTDEIGKLGRKLNFMASGLDQAMREQIDLAAIEERTHLARELHDSVKQQLFAASMQLSSARTLVQANPDGADHILRDVEQLVDQMQTELMSLIHMLRPSSLLDNGLATALERYVETWSQQMGISAEIQTTYPYPLPITSEQALYRVCQEALANVAKHAKASAVVITLTQQKQQTILQIKDNGRGFNTNRRSIGYGLKGMQERLDKLNGMLEIESEPKWGTSVTALVFAGEITI